jgi:tetratricopeptide (TPR) repeat protein
MIRKGYFSVFLSLTLLVLMSAAALAQNAPVAGKVQLKKADGTVTPVAGALVEVYRIDVRASFPSDKTDKKGNFAFAGLPLGGTFVLSVSAPGAKPGYLPSVRPGQPNTDKLLVTLEEGDGRRWTEDEIRQAISGASAAANNAQPSEDQKKAQAEYEKKVADVKAKNSEIENKNTLIQKSLDEGNAAFKTKDYDTAIAKYTAGIDADPEYVGSAPILLNNRGIVLKLRGIDEYNAAVKQSDAAAKAAGIAKAKKDLEDSLDSFAKSWDILKKATPADLQGNPSAEKSKYDTLAGLTEGYRLLVITKTNPEKAANSKEAFDAYLAVETDPAKKARSQLTYADIMRDTGDSAKAIEGYRAVLQTAPDNAEAMAGLGLSLFNSGVVANDKAQMQEGLNYMTKYIETSPISASDSPSVKELKQSIKDAVDYLKNTEKLAPQKVSTPAKKKG